MQRTVRGGRGGIWAAPSHAGYSWATWELLGGGGSLTKGSEAQEDPSNPSQAIRQGTSVQRHPWETVQQPGERCLIWVPLQAIAAPVVGSRVGWLWL